MNTLTTTPRAPLSKREHNRFEKLEETIREGLKTFYTVGEALAEIRDSRLYREHFDTFELYCRDRWGFSKTSANRHILAYKTVDLLAPIGATPSKESQVRPMTKLEPQKQVEAWDRAVKEAGGASRVTASLVSSVVNDMLSEGKAKAVRPVPTARYVNHTRMMKDFGEACSKHEWDVPPAALMWLSKYR